MGLKAHTEELKVLAGRTDIPYSKPEVLVQRKANPSQDGGAKPRDPRGRPGYLQRGRSTGRAVRCRRKCASAVWIEIVPRPACRDTDKEEVLECSSGSMR